MSEWAKNTLANFVISKDSSFEPLLGSFYNWEQDGINSGYVVFAQELQNAPTNHIKIYDSFNKKVRELVNFSSYNYLGLSVHPEVIEAAGEALRHYGLGATGAALLSGTFKIHNIFSNELAKFKQKESCLLYPSGYSGNLGVISGLLRPNDIAFVDRLAHASIIDGLVLSRAKTRFFRHNDVEQLENYIKHEDSSARKLIIAEGVYSMDGDLPKLPEIVALAKKYKCLTMLDEAHSTLIFGKSGQGIAEHFGLEKEIDINFGTLSKAFGGIGGFATGKKELIEYLRYYSRSSVFSCFLPPAIVAGLNKALEIYQRDTSLKDKLWENVKYITGRLQANNINIGHTQSPIIPLMVNNDRIIYKLARDILDHGLFMQPISYPSVKLNRSRFRAIVTAKHTKKDLDQAINIITKLFIKYKIVNPK